MATRLYPVYILEVLKKYSNQGHPLSQKDIIEYVRREYGDDIRIDRKAVANNLRDLEVSGFPVKYANRISRSTSEINSGVYYDGVNPEISDSELGILIDHVLMSNHVDLDTADNMKEWLLAQGSDTLRKMYAGIDVSDFGYHTSNYQIIEQFDLINKAIYAAMKIKFDKYGFNDKGIEDLLESDIVVTPYRLIEHMSKYYLIAIDDKNKQIQTYRADKIKNVRIIKDSSATPIQNVSPEFNFSKYLSEHVYMCSDKAENMVVKIEKKHVGALYDFFDGIHTVRDEDDEYVTVSFRASHEGVKYWALQYGEHVEIISPQSLRDEIRSITLSMSNTYCVTDEDRYQRALDEASKRSRFKKLNLLGISLKGKSLVDTFKDVKDVRLGRNQIDSYAFLEEIDTLRSLSIVENTNYLDTFTLKSDTLERFSFDTRVIPAPFRQRKPYYKPKILNVDFIKECKNLTSISIHGVDIEDVDALYEFPKLESLSLDADVFSKLDLSKFNEEIEVDKNEKFKVCKITFPDRIEHAREQNFVI